MRKRPKQRTILTERDLNIFQFFYEQKVATLNQVGRKFFSGKQKQAAHKRLSRLNSGGYIDRAGVIHRKKLTVAYRLKVKGFEALAPYYRYRVVSPRLKSDSASHDLGLVDVRDRMEPTEMVEKFVTENMLQTCEELALEKGFDACARLNSDAALVVRMRTGVFQVALEYEVSDKAASRYDSKLVEYYLSPSIASVLYLCGNARIENLIYQADVRMRQKSESKVYCCRVQVIHNANAPMVFRNQAGGTFQLK